MMSTQEITQTLLSAVGAHEALIRAHADEAEQHRRLSRPVVDSLADTGLFRMYTPRTLGGLEVEPLTFYRVVEALARSSRRPGACCWDCYLSNGPSCCGDLRKSTACATA